MSRVLSRPGMLDGLFGCGVLLMLFGLIAFPSQSVSAAKDGVQLCLNVIVPSLFPFFVLSSLCVELGMVQALGRLFEKWMYPLFHVGGACAGAFLLGIIGGYPVGAKTAIELYEKKICTKVEAERLLSFCNNSGPAFILGVVGAGIFSSSTVGLWLYAAHVTASILVGLLFRFYGESTKTTTHISSSVSSNTGFTAAFTGSVKNAFSSTLNICAFVIFFTVVIRLLFFAGVISLFASLLSTLLHGIGLHQAQAESLLTGAIEMTSGVWSLRDMASAMGDKLCMAAFILGWAGLSVHCQVLSFIGNSGLSTRTYFFGKLLHGCFSAVLIFLLNRIFSWDAPVSKYLVTQVSAIATMDFRRSLTISTASALILWLLISGISAGLLARKCGNRRRNRV